MEKNVLESKNVQCIPFFVGLDSLSLQHLNAFKIYSNTAKTTEIFYNVGIRTTRYLISTKRSH